MKKKTHSLVHALSYSKQLGPLIDKSKKITQLTETVRHYLPISLSQQVEVANLSNGILTLLVPSNAIGHLIQSQTAELRQKIRKLTGWSGLVDIRVKIEPSLLYEQLKETEIPEPTFAPLQFSEATAKEFQTLSTHIRHPRLKKAIERLAKKAQTQATPEPDH